MSYVLETGSTAGCLAGMAHKKVAVIDMREGNTSYRENEYCEESHHRVMDMMEQDLGVQFNEREREGFIDAGHGSAKTRRETHLKVMPFRVFFEAGTHLKTTWFKSWGNNWGAFIAIHGVDTNWGGIKPAFRSDQQWYLNHYKYSAARQGLHTQVLNARAIVKRTAAMFPTLDGELSGHLMNSTAVSHNMALNAATIKRKSPLETIILQLLEDYAGVYGTAEHDARTLPERTEEQMIAESAVYQKMFEAVRDLAYGKAKPIPMPNGFNSEALAILSGRQPAPTQQEYAEAV